jgi:CheY-like chemotaxis protein
MIIDDIRSSRVILEKILRSSYECDITSAESGDQALTCLYAHVPDLILLDVVMPIMNGYKFLKLLRSKEEWKTVPVVIISGQDEKGVIDDFAALDVSGYLFKPFSVQDVEHILDPLLKTTSVEGKHLHVPS